MKPKRSPYPMYLYNYGGAIIVKDEEEGKKAEKAGYVHSPADVKKKPGRKKK